MEALEDRIDDDKADSEAGDLDDSIDVLLEESSDQWAADDGMEVLVLGDKAELYKDTFEVTFSSLFFSDILI